VTPSTALPRELEHAVRIARDAGALILEIQRGGGWRVEMKAGDEPVTIADRSASELIVRELRAAFPDDVVISEEAADDLARLRARRVWYVDPIDGTKDFIAGRPGWSVMIGMTIDHAPVLGVVFQPETERLFWATPSADGAPASWFEIVGGADLAPPRPLRVSDVKDASQIRLVASASHRTGDIDRVKSALGISDELNVGSVGLKLALISLAERDLYVNPSAKSKLWDCCAPEAILRAAGGRLTDAHGAPIRYDVEDIACRNGLVASNGHVHDEVIAKLAHLFPRTAPA
jgi:3'(2'), 5'-bisphosphate nucleotidase